MYVTGDTTGQGSGHFVRVSRGFYRLPEFPAASHEDVVAAWVKAGADRAVVSHDTAFTLYELAPIRPHKIHLTVPREYRPHGDRPHVPITLIHTTTRPFHPGDVVHRFGVRITSPQRTIVDAAESGVDPSAIIEGVHHALNQGAVTADELRRAAESRSERVRALIDRAIQEAEPRHAVG